MEPMRFRKRLAVPRRPRKRRSPEPAAVALVCNSSSRSSSGFSRLVNNCTPAHSSAPMVAKVRAKKRTDVSIVCSEYGRSELDIRHPANYENADYLGDDRVG